MTPETVPKYDVGWCGTPPVASTFYQPGQLKPQRSGLIVPPGALKQRVSTLQRRL
jgi:hypothetical protein